MSLLRGGVPITTVALGEELELRWTIDNRARRGPDDELLGFVSERDIANLPCSTFFLHICKAFKLIKIRIKTLVAKKRLSTEQIRRQLAAALTHSFQLVEDCIAERLDGAPPEPAPLPLIVGGQVCLQLATISRKLQSPTTQLVQVSGVLRPRSKIGLCSAAFARSPKASARA